MFQWMDVLQNRCENDLKKKIGRIDKPSKKKT